MRKSDFSYSLPPELVAQYPASPRGASRLLLLDGASGEFRDRKFADLPALLRSGDLLVFNDTRVIPARLYGRKDSGGRIEILIERLLDARHVLAQLHASKPPRPGQKLLLEGNVTAVVRGRKGEFYVLALETGGQLKAFPLPLSGEEGKEEGASGNSRLSGAESVADILERVGHVPLPPYIHRSDGSADRERYQTVYAREPGAVAAPTAGLHFDEAMLDRLRDLGVERAFVTLHVGAGTFQPLRVDDVRQHRMHAEYLRVSMEACDRINAAKEQGRRVIAVGTTVVRALETAAGGSHKESPLPLKGGEGKGEGVISPFEGETGIFIYPGYRFRIVDALLTNFHLPESTLLMLVCAFGGTENVLRAYRHAVEQRYRFYSYGDAMFVTKSELQASSLKLEASSDAV